MGPDLWTGFVFFGIPLTIGLLGFVHASRLLYRVYSRRSSDRLGPGQKPGRLPQEAIERDPPSRRQLLQYIFLFVGSALLVAHSGRWLLRIYGVL